MLGAQWHIVVIIQVVTGIWCLGRTIEAYIRLHEYYLRRRPQVTPSPIKFKASALYLPLSYRCLSFMEESHAP